MYVDVADAQPQNELMRVRLVIFGKLIVVRLVLHLVVFDQNFLRLVGHAWLDMQVAEGELAQRFGIVRSQD